MAMATTIMNRRGIITLLNFSIPSLIPTITIKVVKRRKTVWVARGAHVEDAKSVNIVFIVMREASLKEKVRDLSRYSTDQPPITL